MNHAEKRLVIFDCDGVLADFDRGATELLGMSPRAYEKRHGIAGFWREIARHPDSSDRMWLGHAYRYWFDTFDHVPLADYMALQIPVFPWRVWSKCALRWHRRPLKIPLPKHR